MDVSTWNGDYAANLSYDIIDSLIRGLKRVRAQPNVGYAHFEANTLNNILDLSRALMQ